MKQPGNSSEFEGNTVEEAVQSGLKELKLKREQVTVEILCEEQKGLFGMAGAKLARVRVTPVKKEKTP